MARLFDRLRGAPSEAREITTVDDYIAALAGNYGLGSTGLEQTGTVPGQRTPGGFLGGVGAHSGNGVVFACIDVRTKVFSEVGFRFQRLRSSKPSDMFGTTELGVLERPWAGGTTQNLLTLMGLDGDLAGNSYWVRNGNDLVRLRPDWVDIAVESIPMFGGQVGYRKLGFVYYHGGKHSGSDGVPLLADEVAHFMPIPDPLAPYRGMSWLTPVLREIDADTVMTRHKRKFFENGATPNMIVKHPTGTDRQKVLDFRKRLEAESEGSDNAYKTLHLYPGADATVVGRDLKAIDFRAVQGAGETRVAAAAGTPPVIVGLSEGLAAATYSNYSQARRRFADGTMRPLWKCAAGALSVLLSIPPGSRLYYDTEDVSFLREDEKDAAEIQATQATTISALLTAGYTPDSIVAAIQATDWGLLEHTGLFSVQLQKPGALDAPSSPPALPAGVSNEGGSNA